MQPWQRGTLGAAAPSVDAHMVYKEQGTWIDSAAAVVADESTLENYAAVDTVGVVVEVVAADRTC